MKKAKFSKKLVLNKETISNLNNEDMNNIKGGTAVTFLDCTIGYCNGATTKRWIICPTQDCPTD